MLSHGMQVLVDTLTGAVGHLQGRSGQQRKYHKQQHPGEVQRREGKQGAL